MRRTTTDPLMRAVCFLLDDLDRRITRCDHRRVRCDLPGLQAEVREIAAVVADLGELCGVEPRKPERE